MRITHDNVAEDTMRHFLLAFAIVMSLTTATRRELAALERAGGDRCVG